MLPAPTIEIHGSEYKLDVLPDPADFRDRIFVPTLTDVPLYRELESYLRVDVPVLDQGREGSCTGFALATVAHYLLRTREIVPDTRQVSPRMLYEMAKRYDEWEGEEYEGSSARGAMKGWHKHGVCAAQLWRYEDGSQDRILTELRAKDALDRPLGAYFRVDRRDLTAMHSALTEVGILFASAYIHEGWYFPHPETGVISLTPELLSSHAFAIVGYNRQGFWLQSSWGMQWGRGGLAMLTYDDWLLHGIDVWVARLGVPVQVSQPRAKAVFFPEVNDDMRALGLERVRSHIVRVNAQGHLSHYGAYATFEEDVARIFERDIPHYTAQWPVRRVLLYAGGGLASEDEAVSRMSKTGAQLLDEHIYPLAFIWNSDFLAVIQTIVAAAKARLMPQPLPLEPMADFNQSRLDAALEPLVREQAGRLYWETVKSYGYRAAKNESGAARIVLHHLIRFLADYPTAEIHVLAHSAGSIFLAPLVQHMTAPADQKIGDGPMAGRAGYGIPVTTCTLWAPAIRTDLFAQTYRPALDSGMIERFALYTLTDTAERMDCCVGAYGKSLLYLISYALEELSHVPVRRPQGQPLLGMEQYVRDSAELLELFAGDRADWILSPNDQPVGTLNAARSQTHLRFDDAATLISTIRRMQRNG